MSDVIELRELRLSAVVGVLTEERDRAQPLVFDIDMRAALRRGGHERRPRPRRPTTPTYWRSPRAWRTTGRFLLLETLAYRVAHEVLALDDAITSVTVAVRKLRPPVALKTSPRVGVRCTVSRA